MTQKDPHRGLAAAEVVGPGQRSREQRRAALAAQNVRDVEQSTKAVRDRYNSLVAAAPIWLRTNGLLQTAAFLAAKAKAGTGGAKGDEASSLLLEHLTEILIGARLLEPNKSLLDVLPAAPQSSYLAMQHEVGLALAWHKRFATARWGASAETESP